MRIFLIFITLLSTSCFSQNSDSYFAIRINEGMYEHLDSLGIIRMDGPDSCDCVVNLSTRFWQFSEKEFAYDSLQLNEHADEYVIEKLLSSLKNEFKKYGVISNEKITHVYFKTSIKKLSNRIHFFSFYRKMRYKIIIEFYYKPVTL